MSREPPITTASASTSNKLCAAKTTTLKATAKVVQQGLSNSQSEAAASFRKDSSGANETKVEKGKVKDEQFDALQKSTQDFKEDAKVATSIKEETLGSLLGNAALVDLTRVNLLAKEALDDIPNQNFAAISAAIKTCSAAK